MLKLAVISLVIAAVLAVLGFGGAAGVAGALAPDTALVLVAMWMVGSLLVAVLFTERAEITG